MISQNEDRRVRASERQVMQYLRSCDWNIVAELPVAATAGTLRRLTDYGWIERRGGWPSVRDQTHHRRAHGATGAHLIWADYQSPHQG
jgi:hypothetical protein